MRKLISISAVMLCLMALSCMAIHASASGASKHERGSVRVLILDKGFESQPPDGEKLYLMDEVDGKLVLGYTNYKGKLLIMKGKSGLYLINSLPLEDYVEGVVKAETGKDWALEALKAQAVAVRTYVVSKLIRGTALPYDVTSSVLHQVYRGLNADTDVASAVRSTGGEILTYEGTPIEAFYHSSSSGATELPEEVFGKPYPYLKSVKCQESLSPYTFWSRKVTLKEVENATGITGIVDMKVAGSTKTGRVKDVELVLSEGRTSRYVQAKDLRKLLGWKVLPSTDFSVRMENGDCFFDGRGFGHGVGMSQWGSLEMAMKGMNYKDILSHFYPGAEITLIDGRF